MRRARLWWAASVAAAVALLEPSLATAAPGGGSREEPRGADAGTSAPELGSLHGRVRVAGERTPLAGAKVMVVDAPADVRPGRSARPPLVPEAVSWVREAETDEDGRFVFDDLPVGKLRIVVVVPGHRRLEQWTEVEADELKPAPVELFVTPDEPSVYRTEVVTQPAEAIVQPEHALAGPTARTYPGAGNDPIRAAQNLPGVARSPAGLGLLAIRGGDPTETGVYVDGHPVPRAFHVIPIASVVTPSLVERVELTPGNYDAAYGGHASGMLNVLTRPGSRDTIHGEAHLDLFDFGVAIESPVGPGSMAFGLRRSHVDTVLQASERAVRTDFGVTLPVYWDYLGRLDLPLGRGHTLTLRALGAGDRLSDVDRLAMPTPDPAFGFSAGFHRFDLAWTLERDRLHVLVSPALRLDQALIEGLGTSAGRRALVGSLRISLMFDLTRKLSILAGADLVHEAWSRELEFQLGVGQDADEGFAGFDLAFGTWLGVDLHHEGTLGRIQLRAQARLSTFAVLDAAKLAIDPRVDLRWTVFEGGERLGQVELFASLGRYSSVRVDGLESGRDQVSLLSPQVPLSGGIVDIPNYLIEFFDPGLQQELANPRLRLVSTIHASLGAELELPWRVRLRATGFWRETRIPAIQAPNGTIVAFIMRRENTRARGLELMLGRMLAADIHGWIGYSLLQSRVRYYEPWSEWFPTTFDQRHALVILGSFGLPRGFRFGVRFRLISGHPEYRPIGGESIQNPDYGYNNPEAIRSWPGAIPSPLFHQLDLRLDKVWTLKRASLSAYIDVQNVYNHWYPEVYVYSGDWSERSQRIGLPIYPSVGMRVDY